MIPRLPSTPQVFFRDVFPVLQYKAHHSAHYKQSQSEPSPTSKKYDEVLSTDPTFQLGRYLYLVACMEEVRIQLKFLNPCADRPPILVSNKKVLQLQPEIPFE